jgi:hypothetical protein
VDHKLLRYAPANKIRLPGDGGRYFIRCVFLFVVLVFALLVGNTAGSLAGRLAGGLAFAAAAVLDALLEVAGRKGTDSLHGTSPFLENSF